MKCIIIEDQPPAQRILKKYIHDMEGLHLKATFSDALQALDYLKQESVDLIFLDIHLPKISGIDFLKSLNNPPYVILTTAFSDYAIESYELSVVDYLLKPFSFQRFVKAVSKIPVESRIAAHTYRKEIFIKSGYEHVKITIDDMLYIKSDADYTELVLPQKKYLSADSLRQWLELLNPEQFTRVHKSFIVNTRKITKMVGGQIYLTDKIVIPIGRAYKDEFVARFIR